MAYGQQKIHASGHGKPHLRATGCSRYLVAVSVAMRKEHTGDDCVKEKTSTGVPRVKLLAKNRQR